MIYFILVISFASVKVSATENNTNCVAIGKLYYEKEVLYSNIAGPYHLVIDYMTNTLFFNHNIKKVNPRTNYLPTFKLAYLNLKSAEYGTVHGIRGGFATAVDRKAHKVYMGGEEGVYIYNYDTNYATKLKIIDKSIWQMFYNDGLYFITFPDERVFFSKYGETIEMPEFKNVTHVKLIAINNEDEYLFYNSSGLYCYIRAVGEAYLLSKYILNGFTSDIIGNLYFSTDYGIYHIDNKTNKIVKMATIKDVFGLAIEENGNIIYSNSDSIIRLKPSKELCHNETQINNNTKINI